jgi:hypothetical protein
MRNGEMVDVTALEQRRGMVEQPWEGQNSTSFARKSMILNS